MLNNWEIIERAVWCIRGEYSLDLYEQGKWDEKARAALDVALELLRDIERGFQLDEGSIALEELGMYELRTICGDTVCEADIRFAVGVCEQAFFALAVLPEDIHRTQGIFSIIADCFRDTIKVGRGLFETV